MLSYLHGTVAQNDGQPGYPAGCGPEPQFSLPRTLSYDSVPWPEFIETEGRDPPVTPFPQVPLRWGALLADSNRPGDLQCVTGYQTNVHAPSCADVGWSRLCVAGNILDQLDFLDRAGSTTGREDLLDLILTITSGRCYDIDWVIRRQVSSECALRRCSTISQSAVGVVVTQRDACIGAIGGDSGGRAQPGSRIIQKVDCSRVMPCPVFFDGATSIEDGVLHVGP